MTATRKNIMLGTAGHVDHGKTALVKVLTGCDTDTLAEEKQRGLTIDLGFAPCRLAGDRIVGVVDVPGHVDFIRNMVAGAHGIDVVILVVAADDGLMPQTHEHLHVLTLMGVRHGLVALTKIDLVEAERRAEVTDHIRTLLRGTFLEGAPVCPLSNVTGEGFEGFFDALNQVVEACADRPCTGLFRVWVEDVFTIHGTGTVITGIPTHGCLRLGDRLQVLPPGLTGHVRRMQVYGEESAEGRAGECVAMNLPELDHEIVRRGMALGEPDALPAVTMAEAELRVLESVRGQVEDYLEVHLHVGTASVLARLAMLERPGLLAGQSQMVQLRLAEPLPLMPGERFVIRAQAPGASHSSLTTLGGGRLLGVSNVRLRRHRPWTLASLRGRRAALDDPVRWCEQMLLEAGRPVTVSALQQQCLARAKEVAASLDRLRTDGRAVPGPGETFVHGDTVAAAAAGVLEAIHAFHAANPQRAGVSREELLAQAKVSGERASQSTVSSPSPRPSPPGRGSSSFSARTHPEATLSTEAGCLSPSPGGEGRGEGERDPLDLDPLQPDPDRPSSPAKTSRCDPQLLDLALESLLAARQIERNGVVFARAGWSARVSDRDQQLSERLANALQQSGWAPPSPDELAASLGEPPARVAPIVRLLTERGLLVRLDDRVLLHRDALEAAKQVVLRLFRKAPAFTTMEFRDALAVSRKFAVPLIDYLDRLRFTVRSGNNRTPGAEAKKWLARDSGTPGQAGGLKT